MTRHSTEKYTCPHCKKNFQFTKWQSINVTLSPILEERMFDKSLFTEICPTCKKSIFINYDYLYHDMENKILIQHVTNEKSLDTAYKLFSHQDELISQELSYDDDYIIRIVGNYNELVEKLDIFNCGYDDRIIEMCKIFILNSFYESTPEIDLKKNTIEIYFGGDDENDIFGIFVNEELVSTSDFSQELYDELEETYIDILDREDAHELIVSEAWAVNFLAKHTDATFEEL